ncbi:MAG: hypothetical protein J2O47_08465, partial [Acidimicrobiaceae bacterium]|nr:hypothetical protein [Acidimicrobiaceae bacterium]
MTSGSGDTRLNRRELLGRGAVLGLAAATATRPLAGLAPAFGSSAAPVRLPGPADVRASFKRMVDFGPRLTASRAHNNYISWLERQFVRAGLELRPPDRYQTDRWLTSEAGLEIHGPGGGPAKVAAYYPRSAHTSPGGVVGPLVYGGVAPALSASGTDFAALKAAIARYPAELASWASGLRGTLEGVEGSILLVDLPLPVPLTAAAFLPLVTYLNWPGHTLTDWARSDYKRLWIEPGLGIPLMPFQELGAAGVVFIVDASHPALAGGYLPFGHGVEPLPALYVARGEGRRLRAVAARRPRARLTLSGTRRKADTRSVTAVLPGRSKETIIFNTHTDGQGFAEENGGVAFVHLARYFATRPRGNRLRRTLVFAAWPGHMTYDLPQTQGWIDAHPDLVGRAAAALTVEHLGCSEWDDTVNHGYRPTGEPEMLGIWTTQGKMFELTRDTV